jgi:hypothetical protein
MQSDRLKIRALGAELDRNEARRAAIARVGEQRAEVTPAGPPYRLLWCRTASDAPGDPPDERYYADEVRPAAENIGGHMEWEDVPGGLSRIVVHNVAEAGQGTHGLAEDTVIRAEERLDRSEPPQMVYLAHVPVAADGRLARIVSYDGGTYTVQPVRRESGGFVDDGSQVSGVANLGELWDEEMGYLAGPADFDRYVRIFQTPAGWTILLHPPRMV